jgi:Vitamin K epoxide reductase family
MVLCLSIILHLVGQDNTITRQFCATEGKFNCDEVLEKGKLWKDINLADLGLIYFCTQFLFLWIGAATHSGGMAAAEPTAFGLLFFPAMTALGLTVALLIYQGAVIHRWCRTCLMVTAVLWLQGSAFLWQLIHSGSAGFRGLILPHRTPTTTSLLYLLPACCCIAASWIIVKPWLVTIEQNKKIRLVLNTWKKNTDFFWALLKEQRQMEYYQPWTDDFTLGDPRAPIQLVCLMNPYCKACAREYVYLDQLLRRAPGQIGLTIRFYLKRVNFSDHRTRAVNDILQTYFAYPDPADRARLLKDWFRLVNPVAWKSKWPRPKTPPDKELLEKHREWCEQNSLTITPFIFLNGREIPDIYKTVDLSYHLSRPLPAETKTLPQ